MTASNVQTCFVHHLNRAPNWQDRPEFEALCQWWETSGRGIFGLVGLGGSGKTAIAEQFLRAIPNVLNGASTSRRLPAPKRLFVFSFYQAANPGTFFPQLVACLENKYLSPEVVHSQSESTHAYGRAKYLLQNENASSRDILLVLDGLKRIQMEDKEGFGQVEDGQLKDFLAFLADGYFRGAAAIVTSRLRLRALGRASDGSHYFRDVNKIDDQVAVDILKSHKLIATDQELQEIAASCGHHALTVDLMGRYIANYYDRRPDPTILMPSKSDLGQSGRFVSDDDELVDQRERIAAIAGHYVDSLSLREPMSAALLKHLCLYLHGVTEQSLEQMFHALVLLRNSEATTSISNKATRAALKRLKHLQLVESPDANSSSHQDPLFVSSLLDDAQLPQAPRMTVHPMFRDGVLDHVGEQEVRASRDNLFHHLVDVFNASTTGPPIDVDSIHSLQRVEYQQVVLSDEQLVLLEEIIWQAAGAGRWNDAVDIYWNVMGGYARLSHEVCNYQMGLRITSNLARHAPKDPFQERHCIVLSDLAGFHRQQGRVSDAISVYIKSAEAAKACGADRWLWVPYRNIGFALLLRGFLIAANTRINEWAETADLIDLQDDWVMDAKTGMRNTLGGIHLLLGNIARAEEELKLANVSFEHIQGAEPKYLGYPKIWYTQLLVQIGRLDEARAQIKDIRDSAGERSANLRQWCRYYELLINIEEGRNDEAETALKDFYEWSDKSQNLSAATRYYTAKARLQLRRLQAEGHIANSSTTALRDEIREIERTIDDGIRFARDCGYGTYFVDLVLLRVQVDLLIGYLESAESRLAVALDDGVPAGIGNQPKILAAFDDQCGYIWGQAEGLYLRAELQRRLAAIKLGYNEFEPPILSELPARVQDLVAEARHNLERSISMWEKLRDPQGDTAINVAGERALRARDELDKGVLWDRDSIETTVSFGMPNMKTPMHPAVRAELEKNNFVVFDVPPTTLGRGASGIVEAGNVTFDGAMSSRSLAIKVSHEPVNLGIARSIGDVEFAALELVRRLKPHPFIQPLMYHSLVPVSKSRGTDYYLVTMWEIADETLDGKLGAPVEELLSYFGEVADALDFLHKDLSEGDLAPTDINEFPPNPLQTEWRGKYIVHRDVKPDNIFIVSHHARLGDFSLARLSIDDPAPDAAVRHRFAAPELRSNGIATRLSDLYGLAASYIWMRLGDRKLQQMPREIDEILGRGDPPIETPEAEIICKALAENPLDRPQHGCVSWVNDLKNATVGTQTVTESPALASAVPDLEQIVDQLGKVNKTDFRKIADKTHREAFANVSESASPAQRSQDLVDFAQSRPRVGLAGLWKAMQEVLG